MGLEENLMIYEDEIGIDSKGMGKQVFIKTDFALERSGQNKKTAKERVAERLIDLPPTTKNKLYVAITRAKGNVYLVNE